ncbi:hypothetical protein PHLGIDRAFT_22139 [Phlebiopsis gigantea 11061_1 CR5-6]|uniref:Integrase core domain-containing protein n=1 Tax=Phlebiopsis gigantea (strain 11061_1 CR5-6) TaxID=745531 RepID=A0A0C3SEP5_PHLG1|nr:hypothetical protein PHLGIDRAFT_22139 [Phlebiopsis gigantea 11061_1 CR5-6]
MDLDEGTTDTHNRNPTGKNQHGPTTPASDSRLQELLRQYHQERITSNERISQLLETEGIKMSAATVKRRRRELDLVGSRVIAKKMPAHVAEKLVVNELNRDPARQMGVKKIMYNVARNSGEHIPKRIVSDVMHKYDPEGFDQRQPTSKRIMRFPKTPLGIHERWSADGHDKLYKIGFPIWGIVDDATGYGLEAWVVPSNRLGYIIGYLFLCCIEKYGGIPPQVTTDHGSETTQLYGIQNALRSIFHPEYPSNELPAHVFLRSVHNISIERSWLQLRLDFGDNAVIAFEKGASDHGYNDQDPLQYELCQWLWSKLLRQELSRAWNARNTLPVRKQKDKPGPSGMSRKVAFTLPNLWNGGNYLLPVDLAVVREIKEAMGGDDILEFTSREFREQAQGIFDVLSVTSLSFSNVWHVFHAMLPKFVD